MIFGTGAFVVLEKLANTLSVIANNLPKKQGDSYSIRRALSLRLRRWICDHSNNRRRHIPGARPRRRVVGKSVPLDYLNRCSHS